MVEVKYRPAGRGWIAVAGQRIAEVVTLRPIVTVPGSCVDFPSRLQFTLECCSQRETSPSSDQRWPRKTAGSQSAGMDDAFEHAVRLVEAFIFASAEPVALSSLARLMPKPYSAHEVLEALRGFCQGSCH